MISLLNTKVNYGKGRAGYWVELATRHFSIILSVFRFESILLDVYIAIGVLRENRTFLDLNIPMFNCQCFRLFLSCSTSVIDGGKKRRGTTL
jgi:hypothetical protein